MYKYILTFAFICCGCSTNNDVDKIIKAKNMVKSLTNFPDSVSFHDMETKVNGNIVTIKFTCKNAFGVPETHSMDFSISN